MAIDVRANIQCSLGTLISASISDSYVQGAGLIQTSGNCEIVDVITPAIGTIVTFSYTKSGVTRTIPRKLRVLSSFADPFRLKTTISLGCKLTYLQDLTDPVNWDAFDDPENSDRTEEEEEIATIPIHASSVMDKCLQELGITASSNPLTNKFSIPEFDFSSGYVSILNDLLVSESYCGYLDTNEILQVFSLDQQGGTGPVLDSESIIDVGPVNVGQLPGEAVTVSYSTLKLKQPEGGNPVTGSNKEADWDFNQTTSTGELGISYTKPNGDQAVKEYRTFEQTTTNTTYIKIKTKKNGTKRVVGLRQTLFRQSGIIALGAPASAYLSNGNSFSGGGSLTKVTRESFSYDRNGNESFRRRFIEGSPEFISGSAPIPWEINGRLVSPFVGSFVGLEEDLVYSNTIEGSDLASGFLSSTMTYTKQFAHGSSSVAAQQSLAEARDSFNSAASAQSFLAAWVSRGLTLIRTTSNLSESGVNQVAPSLTVINNANNANDSGDPNNGYRTESSSELELALGSATAQLRIEFSMPYAPDDIFIKNAGPPVTYSAVPSDAPQKAQKYGQVQNKLLLGGRNGMNVQVEPEKLPDAPFSPIIVQASGLSVLYRTNGTTWTMDSSGIVASTDGIFWGAVGGSGTFWFPVAPGITSLPSTPPIVGGQMTVNTVVPVWNQATLLSASARIPFQVQSFNYAFQLNTQIPSISAFTKLQARGGRAVLAPVVNILNTILAPIISAGKTIQPSSIQVQLQSLAPLVSAGYSAIIQSANILVTGITPDATGRIKTIVNIPSANIAVTTETVSVSSGSAVASVAAGILLTGIAPSISIGSLITAPAVQIVLGTPIPDQVGPDPISVLVPAVNIAITGLAPEIPLPVTLGCPKASIALTSEIPAIVILVSDPDFASVALLMHFDEANGSTSFVDNSANSLSLIANGSAATTTSQQKFGTGSLNLTGSGTNYLSYPSASGDELDVATNQSVTVEFWAYITAVNTGSSPTSSNCMWESTGNLGERFSLHMLTISSTPTLVWAVNFGGDSFSHQTALTLNSWQHIAVVRNVSTWNLYIDGVQSTTSKTAYGTIMTNSNFYIIGPRQDGETKLYIDDFRHTTGVARYTADFTPPSSALTAISGTELLLNMDGPDGSTVFTDSSGNSVSVTANGDAQIDTAQSKFGGASGLFDGNDSVSVNDASLAFAGNWTFECWIRPTSTSGYNCIFQNDSGGAEALRFYLKDGALVLRKSSSEPIVHGTVSANQWYHVAMVRESGVYRLYLDGAQSAASYADSASTNTYFRIGYDTFSTQGLKGWIDDVRMTGSAVYTGSFTPPTQAFPNS